MRIAMFALVALTLVGCAGARPRGTACPDNPRLYCLTQGVCAVDRARGCEVCRCSDALPSRPEYVPGGGPGGAPARSDPTSP